MTTELSRTESRLSRENVVMICGCLLGLVSAVALAIGGNMCESILKMLLFRPYPGYSGANPLEALGTRMLRLSWAPLGVAAGTALTLWGIQQATHRSGRSRVTNILLLVTAITAGVAAFEMSHSVRQTLSVLAVRPRAQTEDDFEPEQNWSVPAATRGWLLLGLAQVTLSAAAIAQARSRTQAASLSTNRSKEELAVIVLMGVFGVLVSWSWFTNGMVLERFRIQNVIKADEVAGLLDHLLSSTDWGAWALMASMTVLAVTSITSRARDDSIAAS